MAPTESRYPIADADGRLRRATRGLTVALLAGVAGLLAAGVLLLTVGLLGGHLVLEVAGVGVAALGVLLCFPVARAVRVRYQAIATDGSGLTLIMADGRAWRVRWDDPTLRFLLFDHSETRSAALRGYRAVPCQLFCLQFHAGLSHEAYAAIRTQAAAAGVVEGEETDVDGVRIVTVGAGPEAGTPFQRL